MPLIVVISSISCLSFLSKMLMNIWIFFLFEFVEYQRDTVKAATSFARRNNIPVRLEEQMLAHLFMKYRTDLEGVQHQEAIDCLPKAIRANISHFLFYHLMERVYLFNGVSQDLLFQLVMFYFWLLFHLIQQNLKFYAMKLRSLISEHPLVCLLSVVY